MTNAPFKSDDVLKLALFISGGGTNMETIVKNCQSGKVNAEPVVVVCNEPGASGIERAKRLGIPVILLDHRGYCTRKDHELAVIEAIKPYGPNMVALAGYMRLVTPALLAHFHGLWQKDLPGVINIHPADTGAYQGIHGYEFAMGMVENSTRLNETKITVHFVDSGMDTGPIIRQRTVPIHPDDTIDTLRSRGLSVEYELYSEVLHLFANRHVRLEAGKVIIEKPVA